MKDLYQTLEAKVFPFVEKPGRYTGGELNTTIKEQAKLRGVLCFPDLYDIGMSHYGSQILYNIVNSNSNWSLERAYMPWFDAEKVMRENEISLYSLESFNSLQVFDFLAVTLSYELQYTNVLAMLDLAKIPLWAKDRTGGDPIVIGGGIVAANPEPIAEFFDVVFVGDGEEAIIEFCQILQACKEKRLSRAETLAEISKMANAYIPANYKTKRTQKHVVAEFLEPIKFAKLTQIDEKYIPKKQIVPIVDIVHKRMCAEVTRGCTRGCRFCAAGFYYRPVRERENCDILNQVKTGIADTGWDEIGLMSLSTADYSQFWELLSGLKGEIVGTKIGIPSTRLDAMDDKTQALLNKISQASSFTIAPEAGSQRLRNIINKDFLTEQILDSVEVLANRKLNTIKFYFMIGLPTETDEDIDEMIELIEKSAEMVYKITKRCTISVSISPFSPKAHTPFQWEAQAEPKVLLARSLRIKNHFQRIKNVKVDYRQIETAIAESILARGDRDLAKFLFALYKEGARFEGWSGYLNFELWKKCALDTNIDLTKYTQKNDINEVLPWDIVSTGVSKKFLLSEREKAFSQISTQDCRQGCVACGVCDGDLKMRYASRGEVSSPNTDEIVEKKENIEQEKTEFAQNKIRIAYKKIGRARFLSHRNLMDCITRALVSSKTPLGYSQGFRSRPKISFGPPLPLGAIGESELLDIVVVGTDSVNLEKINSLLPLGIEFLSQHIIDIKTPSIEQAVAKTFWRVEKIGGDIDLKNAINCFILQDVIEIITQKKEQGVKITIISKEIQGLIANECEISFEIEKSQKIRPSDLLKAIFPNNLSSDFRIVRRGVELG